MPTPNLPTADSKSVFDTPIGVEAIRAHLTTMPPAPGVYLMVNAAGDILYVGKAKNLKNRVTSYTQPNNTRIMRMVAQVSRVDVVTCGSEAEALLMESSLVKRHRPRYNILLKDDKSFPYLFISEHPYPRIAKHRGAQVEKGEYFGPFASVGALNQTTTLLQKMFLLRNCSDAIFANRTRPCLQYQIKRCSGPCVAKVNPEEYATQFNQARDFLRGKHRDLQEQFATEMEAASEAQQYEKAAHLRDRIRALTQVQQEKRLQVSGMDDADVIGLVRKGARSVAQVFFYRQGNHFGHQTFHPKHEAEDSDAAVMAGFITQFYQAHTPPAEILINFEPEECALIAEALSLRAQYQVALRVPQRGDKRALMEQVTANAELSLNREEMERASIAKHHARLQEIFHLSQLPARIEVYDNSHIQGTHAIGAMIVATPEGFDKRNYRSFNIKDAETIPGDDYAMMREVFRRRFARAKADSNTGWARPDLVLIDGGKGQLSSVMEVMEALDLCDVPLVAIAKGEDRNAGREWFFMPGISPFQLPVNDPLLHYLQRLRDEAHRFAIGNHRQRRSASFTTSALDDIPSIGTMRKRALLKHFGSRAAVEVATLDELRRVTGISEKIAKTIYDYFHG